MPRPDGPLHNRHISTGPMDRYIRFELKRHAHHRFHKRSPGEHNTTHTEGLRLMTNHDDYSCTRVHTCTHTHSWVARMHTHRHRSETRTPARTCVHTGSHPRKLAHTGACMQECARTHTRRPCTHTGPHAHSTRTPHRTHTCTHSRFLKTPADVISLMLHAPKPMNCGPSVQREGPQCAIPKPHSTSTVRQ